MSLRFAYFCVFVFGTYIRVGFSQQANELAITTANTTIKMDSGEEETLIAGSMVAIDNVLAGNRGLRVAAERVYLADDASKNEELIVGVISASNVVSPENAVSLFSQRLSSDDSDASSLFGRGNAYVCIREVTKAIDDFDRAIAQQPDSPTFLVRRAETLRRVKRLQAAAADIQKSLRLAPDMVPALLTRARIRGDMGEFASGIEDCQAAIKINTASFGAYRCQGCLHIMQGDMAAAKADYAKHVQLSSKHLGAWFDPVDETNLHSGGPISTAKAQAEGKLTEADRANLTRVMDSIASIRERLLLKAICGKYKGRERFAFDDLNAALRLRVAAPVELRLRYCLAVKLLEARKYLDANERLTDAIRYATDSPHSAVTGLGTPQLLVERSRTWIAMEKLQLAIDDCTEAIRRDPANIPALLTRGTCLGNAHRFDEAIADFDRVTQLDSECLLGYFGRATTKGMQGDRTGAIADVTIILSSGNAPIDLLKRALTFRATAASELRSFDSAIADLSQVIEMDSENFEAYRFRGACWSELNELDKALVDFDSALKISPRHPVILNQKGVVLHRKGDFDGAMIVFNEAEMSAPRMSQTFCNRVRTWLAKDETDKALSDGDKAVLLDPKSALPLLNRGLAWGAKHEIAKALKDFDDAIKIDPSNAAAYRYRGVLRLDAGGLEKATEDFNKAIELKPDDPRTCIVVARFRATCEDPVYRDAKNAIKLATKACEATHWKIASYIETLSMAFAADGRFDEAIKNLQLAMSMEPMLLVKHRTAILALYEKNLPYFQNSFVEVNENDLTP